MNRRELVIRDAIESLDGAEFQILAQELITVSRHLTKPSHLGTASGSAKTAPGTPDTFWILPDNRCAFLECGHYSDRNKAIRKIKDDIDACLRAEEQLSPGRLDQIIIAHTCRRLSPSDVAQLNAIDTRVELVGIDQMAAMLSHDYAYLAYDHLGIACSTGQVMSIELFEEKTSKSPFAAPLNTTLQCRTDDLTSLVTMISNSKVTLIDGKPGLGKTRLALDALRQFQEQYGAKAIVVKSNGQPIWNDLNIDVPHDEPCVVLLDDANELSELESVIDFAQMHESVRLLATVRSYAKQYVIDRIKGIVSPSIMRLAPLNIESIETVIVSCFGIENRQYAREIAELSKGNLRVAYAISNALLESGHLETGDLASLIEESYKEAIRSLSKTELLAGTISSILGAHRVSGNNDLSTLEKHFNISHQAYLDSLRTLNEKELLDVCQKYVAVDCGDQVFRDYLLYKAVYIDSSIDLETISKLACGKERMLLCVKVILSAYYSEDLFKQIAQQLSVVWDKASREERWSMIPTYNHLLGDKAYQEISLRMDDLEPTRIVYSENTISKRYESQTVTSDILLSIRPFLHRGPFGVPEELVFKYLSITNLPPNDIAIIVCKEMGYNEYSYNCSFRYELDVLERLYQKWQDTHDSTYAVLCCEYARVLLRPGYESVSCSEDSRVAIVRASYNSSESLLSTRNRGLTILSELRKQEQLGNLPDQIVTRVITAGYGQESEQLLIDTLFDINQTYMRGISEVALRVAPMFRSLEARMNEYGIDTTESFAFLHSNELIDVYSQLASDSLYSSEEDIEFLATRISSLTNGAFYELVKAIGENDAETNGLSSWNLQAVFNGISPQQIRCLCIDIRELLNAGFPVNCITDNMIALWLEQDSFEGVRRSILDSSSPMAQYWLSRIYTYQAMSDPTSKVFELVLLDIDHYPIVLTFDVICAGEQTYPGFFAAYANKLADYSSQNAFVLQTLFPNANQVEKYRSVITKPCNIECLCRGLLTAINNEHLYVAPEFMSLVFENNATFIEQFVAECISADNAEALEYASSMIWSSTNWMALVDMAWRTIKHTPFQIVSLEEPRWLRHLIPEKIVKKYPENVVWWLTNNSVQNGELDPTIADVGASLPDEQKIEYLITICDLGLTIDQFKTVPLYMASAGWSWSGSEVPLLQRKMQFLEELKTHLNGIEYIEHRAYIDEVIRYLSSDSKEAEVREFLRPF